MKKRYNIIPVLMISLALILGGTLSAMAESAEHEGECNYNGSSIESTFSSSAIAKAVEDLQPGDDVTFTVTYTNNADDDTDWYMENSIVQTLEKTSARKKVSGTGQAENGGYTYELTHYDKNGNEQVLFSNDEVGGENGVVPDLQSGKEMEGLEPATNALDDWFYIQTLSKNESGKVVLHVAFDGETEVNDYMDTDGELNVRFAVEKVAKEKKVRRVYTGDYSNLIMWSAICLISGLLLIVLAWLLRKQKGGSDEKAK